MHSKTLTTLTGCTYEQIFMHICQVNVDNLNVSAGTLKSKVKWGSRAASTLVEGGLGTFS